MSRRSPAPARTPTTPTADVGPFNFRFPDPRTRGSYGGAFRHLVTISAAHHDELALAVLEAVQQHCAAPRGDHSDPDGYRRIRSETLLVPVEVETRRDLWIPYRQVPVQPVEPPCRPPAPDGHYWLNRTDGPVSCCMYCYTVRIVRPSPFGLTIAYEFDADLLPEEKETGR